MKPVIKFRITDQRLHLIIPQLVHHSPTRNSVNHDQKYFFRIQTIIVQMYDSFAITFSSVFFVRTSAFAVSYNFFNILESFFRGDAISYSCDFSSTSYNRLFLSSAGIFISRQLDRDLKKTGRIIPSEKRDSKYSSSLMQSIRICHNGIESVELQRHTEESDRTKRKIVHAL